MAYVIILIYLVLLLNRISGLKINFPLYYLLMLPVLLFTSFRGDSGKDSVLYHLRFDLIDWSSYVKVPFVEPLLSVLMLFAKNIHFSWPFFLFLHALIILGLLKLVVGNPRYRILMQVLGPVLLIDGLTNGMRVIFAYIFMLLLMGRKQSRLPVLIMGLFSHISFLFGAGLVLLRKQPVIGLLLTFILSYTVITFIPGISERSLLKIGQYSTLQHNYGYAGIIDSLMIASGVYFSLKRYLSGTLLMVLVLIAFLAVFTPISFSIAMIRINKYLLLFIWAIVSEKRLVNSRQILIFSILYNLNFLRQVFTDYGFLPYGFWNYS